MGTAAQPAFYAFKTARKGPRFPSGAVPQRRSREDCLSTGSSDGRYCRYPFRWASMISICNLFSTLAKLVSGS